MVLPQPWTRQKDSQERLPACLVQFILIVPEGVASYSSPGQPLSRRMEADVSSTSEDEGAALDQGLCAHLRLSFPEPRTFYMLPLDVLGLWKHHFWGAD